MGVVELGLLEMNTGTGCSRIFQRHYSHFSVSPLSGVLDPIFGPELVFGRIPALRRRSAVRPLLFNKQFKTIRSLRIIHNKRIQIIE